MSLDRNIETDVQKRRRKRIGRGGLGEDWGLAVLGELGWEEAKQRREQEKNTEYKQED